LPLLEVLSARHPCADDPPYSWTIGVDHDEDETVDLTDGADPFLAVVPPPIDGLDCWTGEDMGA
jgi:hypothetical protein